MDFIHQVAPFYTEEALAYGDLPRRHITVPYGVTTPAKCPAVSSSERASLRERLGLPSDTSILLSVGAIDSHHKRMDYLIREIAALNGPKPHLLLLGHHSEQSRVIIREAKERLGQDGCTIRSVPYSSVTDYYLASDSFVLCSLKEGFGRVYLEAAMHGLPVLAHRHPVMEYVVGTMGTLLDLSTPGTLTTHLRDHPVQPPTPGQSFERWQTVRARFDWTNLSDQYVAMFEHSVNTPLPWL